MQEIHIDTVERIASDVATPTRRRSGNRHSSSPVVFEIAATNSVGAWLDLDIINEGESRVSDVEQHR